MPVIEKPKDRGPLFGRASVIIFGKTPIKRRKATTGKAAKKEATGG